MKNVQDHVCTPQDCDQSLNGFQSFAGCGEKIDRNQHAPEGDIAADLANKSMRTRWDEQCWNGGRAKHGFRY